MFLGLRTVIYPAPDLAASKKWYSGVLGVDPYFDEPFYVGFTVGGFELGLDPHADAADGPITYWGVVDIEEVVKQLVSAGAQRHGAIQDVGDGIRTATVREPGGALLGIIYNPHFQLG